MARGFIPDRGLQGWAQLTLASDSVPNCFWTASSIATHVELVFGRAGDLVNQPNCSAVCRTRQTRPGFFRRGLTYRPGQVAIGTCSYLVPVATLAVYKLSLDGKIWACLAIRQTAETIRVDSRDRLPVRKRALRRSY